MELKKKSRKKSCTLTYNPAICFTSSPIASLRPLLDEKDNTRDSKYIQKKLKKLKSVKESGGIDKQITNPSTESPRRLTLPRVTLSKLH
jgi:hypothetical protein